MTGYILAGLGGLAAGSLLNAIITRLSQEEPLFYGALCCQHCQHVLPRHLLLPLIRYAWSQGRCCFCGGPLPCRYPAVELAAGLLGLALWWRFPGSALLVVYAPFFVALLVLSVLDLQYYWLPDIITLPGITLGLAAALFLPQLSFLYALLGASLSYAFFRLVGWIYEKIAGGKRQGAGVRGCQALGLYRRGSVAPGLTLGPVQQRRPGEPGGSGSGLAQWGGPFCVYSLRTLSGRGGPVVFLFSYLRPNLRFYHYW